MDIAGNSLEQEFISTFTTRSQDIDVSPAVLNFGDVNVGLSAAQVVTITNLGNADLVVTGIDFKSGAGGAFSISSAPSLPTIFLPAKTADVEITFTPTVLSTTSAILQITSNDRDQPLVVVVLSGTGVPLDPSDALGTILEFFDQFVMDGTLVGSGPGRSAPGRLGALRNMLEAAGELLDAGLTEDACSQLLDALLRTDGVFEAARIRHGSSGSRAGDADPDLRTMLGCAVVAFR